MSTHPTSHTLFVGIDVGSQSHAVAFGDENGNILHEFEMPHTHESFEHFFQVLEQYAHIHQATPRIAMEGYNGWARPLDQWILKEDTIFRAPLKIAHTHNGLCRCEIVQEILES